MKIDGISHSIPMDTAFNSVRRARNSFRRELLNGNKEVQQLYSTSPDLKKITDLFHAKKPLS